ncbi:hypothetical protein LWI29_034230 [Acer saccharum]|uniref:Sulfotransferase n=1 Tax=Acer saccharum TaxID=4024 RepID=A0AA39VHJ1_ACESA|nr:hypothetical protein LWI29_034230 [Acer saccharum]
MCRKPLDQFISQWNFLLKLAHDKKSVALQFEESFELVCRGIQNVGPFWEHVLGYWKATLDNSHKGTQIGTPRKLAFCFKVVQESIANKLISSPQLRCKIDVARVKHGAASGIGPGKRYVFLVFSHIAISNFNTWYFI